MTITFSDFLTQFTTNLPFTITVILTLAVIFVNGWTDSPNAIASCVATRAMHPRKAILMAAVCDFLGVVVMTAFNAKVAETIYNMAASEDKDIAFVEGATHIFKTDHSKEEYEGQFGDTEYNLYNYVADWINNDKRF